MSHFSVLVVGDNVEQQLAPYHEFECTGLDDQYIQDIDETEECREDYAKHGEGKPFLEFIKDWHGSKVVPFGQQPDLEGDHKYSYILLDEHGEVSKYVLRTNPNRKWDWYLIGGRWQGFFRLRPEYAAQGKIGEAEIQSMEPDYQKPGFFQADQATKDMIDFEWMREEKARLAAVEFDRFLSVASGLPPAIDWETVRETALQEGLSIDIARERYNQQPIVQAVRKDKDLLWKDAEQFNCGRDLYIQAARDRAVITFAVLNDGKWYERGEMGWWACVSNEKPKGQWESEFNSLLDSLPGNILLTVVDCHI